jgi:hypothetical protein
LKIAPALGALAMAQLIQALQRVPGVLLAEPNLEGNRAIVSHDAGVPTASLLGAARGVGVNAVIVDAAPVVTATAAKSPAHDVVRTRCLLIAVAVVVVMLSLTDFLVPSGTEKHWLLVSLTCVLWGLFIAQVLGRRRI